MNGSFTEWCSSWSSRNVNNFIKTQAQACTFNIVHEGMGQYYTPKYREGLGERPRGHSLCELWASLSFHPYFYLKDQQTVLIVAIQTSVLGRYFSKINNVSLLLSGKQLTVIVANVWTRAFNKIQKFENLVLSLTVLQHWKAFSIIRKLISVVILLNAISYYIIKYVNIWKICITQWTNSFQIPMLDGIKPSLVKWFSHILRHTKGFKCNSSWIGLHSGSTLHLTSKKLQLASLWQCQKRLRLSKYPFQTT